MRLFVPLAALLFAGATAAAEPAVLIAPFPPGTLDPALGERLDNALREGVSALPGAKVQPKADTERALSAMQEMGLACNPDETRCLVQLGALAAVERVISTQAVPEGEGLRVTLRLIDVRGESELRRIDGRVQRDALAGELRGLATGLLLPSRYRGRLALTAEPAGARVLVDGEDQGTAPLRDSLLLRAGARTVRVEKEGFTPREQIVVVPFEDTAELRVTLSPGDGSASSFEQRTRVLVLDLLVEGDDLPNPRTLASLVAVELARDPGLDVLSGTDVDQLVAAQQAGMEIDCKDTSCLTDLAGAFDVPYIVHGDVGEVGSVLVVHLDVFDAERVETVARTSVENTDRDELPAELKVAARKLLEDARAARPEISNGELPPEDDDAPANAAPPIGMSPAVAWSLVGVGSALSFVAGAATAFYGYVYWVVGPRLPRYAEQGRTVVDDPEVEADVALVALYRSAGGEGLLPAAAVALGAGLLTVGGGVFLLLLPGEENVE